MKLIWEIEKEEIDRLQAFVAKQSGNEFVRHRIKTNVENPPSSVSIETFWQVLVGCLLSSQQRSGPTSPISRLLTSTPFPLNYLFFEEQPNAEAAAKIVLKSFGGIRFTNRIPNQLARNYAIIQEKLWPEIAQRLQLLIQNPSPAVERETAEFIRKRLVGFGPKQSRNLLQGIGLSRYEIPIDSRIIKWLNAFGFPLHLTGRSLGDPHYYNFVSDGVQALCRQCDILPCVFDAAVFSSFDADAWNETNLIW